MAASPAEHRAYLHQLIKEYAVTSTLLRLLDFDIDVRRELETLRKLPHDAKASIDVERTRAELQGDIARLWVEIDAAVTLLERR